MHRRFPRTMPELARPCCHTDDKPRCSPHANNAPIELRHAAAGNLARVDLACGHDRRVQPDGVAAGAIRMAASPGQSRGKSRCDRILASLRRRLRLRAARAADRDRTARRSGGFWAASPDRALAAGRDRGQVGRGTRIDPCPRVDSRAAGRSLVRAAAVGGRVALVVSSVGVVGGAACVARGRAMLRRGGAGRVAVRPGQLRPVFVGRFGSETSTAFRAGVSRRSCDRNYSRTIGENHANRTTRLSADSVVVLGRRDCGGRRRRCPAQPSAHRTTKQQPPLSLWERGRG